MRYKVRLVAERHIQKERISFNKIFLLIIKILFIYILLFIIKIFDLELKQFNVTTIFLHDELDEDI